AGHRGRHDPHAPVRAVRPRRARPAARPAQRDQPEPAARRARAPGPPPRRVRGADGRGPGAGARGRARGRRLPGGPGIAAGPQVRGAGPQAARPGATRHGVCYPTPLMGPRDIVCFAKEWSESPTSNNHVMRALAATARVVWLNSIATRTPRLSSSRDVRKIVRKLRSFTSGPVEASPGLFVHPPLVLPARRASTAREVNALLLRATVSRLRRRLAIDAFQLWTFLPTAAPYVGRLGESLSVYYCTDEWSQFSAVDGPAIARMEA